MDATTIKPMEDTNIMDFLESTHSQSRPLGFTTIKVKTDWLYVVKWEDQTKLEKIEPIRAIMRTENYQLSYSDDGKNFQTIWFTSEWYPGKKNVFLYDKSDGTFEVVKTLEEARDKFRRTAGDDRKYSLKRMDIIYLSHPEYWTMKMYLKLSQSAGYEVDKQGTTIYKLSDPLEWTYRKIAKSGNILNKIREITFGLYKPDQKKNDQIHYPVFTQIGESKLEIEDVKDIVTEIMMAIESADRNIQSKMVEWWDVTIQEPEAIEEKDENLPF